MSTNNTRQRALIAAFFASAVLGAAQPAAALDFTFSFRGVEGLITGLADNKNNQIPVSVEVTASPSGRGVRPYYYWSGSGISVANGEVISSPSGSGTLFRSVPISSYPDYNGEYGGEPGANDGYGFDLWLGDPGVGSGPIPGTASLFGLSNVEILDDSSNGVMTYKGVAVPGPVPILGALAALRCSRRLRQRSRSQAPTSVAS
ncbi:MAG: hypothetical protein ACK5N0_07385 [Synechococcaceae cyanobacterium]